jgi:hypothetical protein
MLKMKNIAFCDAYKIYVIRNAAEIAKRLFGEAKKSAELRPYH